MTEEAFCIGFTAKSSLPPAKSLDEILRTSPRKLVSAAKNFKSWVAVVKG